MAQNMIQNPNGEHYKQYVYWDKKLHQPYDYKRYGLMNKIISHKLWNTKNPFLKYIIKFIEKSMIYALQEADMLKNFFNYNYWNR